MSASDVNPDSEGACQSGRSAAAGRNRYAHASQYAWRDTEEEPLYEFETDLEIKGTCTYPENRIGDRCELTIYGDVSPESQIYWKLKDVPIVDEHYAKKYRDYRSNRIPVTTRRKAWACLTRRGLAELARHDLGTAALHRRFAHAARPRQATF